MAEKDETISELRKLVDSLQSLKANLEETLCELRRQLFGTISEKAIAKTDTQETQPAGEKTVIRVKEHTRERKPKAKREDLYAVLPVREVKIPLPEEQRYCEYCNSAMVTMTYTPVREEGKSAESNSYMWIYLTGSDGLPPSFFMIRDVPEAMQRTFWRVLLVFFSVTGIRDITKWLMSSLSAAWRTAGESFMKRFLPGVGKT